MIRVRIAPSPTGFAHVGTAYTALFNYAFARKNKGEFVLRLEDTDTKREVKGAEKAIYTSLSWLGLEWDEGPDKGGKYGPYKQSERLDIYKKYTKILLDKKIAYEDDGAIRFKNPGDDVSWNDLVRGEVTFPGGEVTDFVLVKSDGFPTYNFAVVVDDLKMKITHVIRGEEHISNTPRQIAVYKALGEKIPEFAHLPTLRNKDRKKLSKRRDPVDLKNYQEEGYLPEALINFLGLLGWSHSEEKEKFDLDEFVEKFSLERVRKSGPIFDTDKLDWLNGEYIKENSDLAKLLSDFYGDKYDKKTLEKTGPLVKERINKLSEYEGLAGFFYKLPKVDKKLSAKISKEHIGLAEETLINLKAWEADEIGESLVSEVKKKGIKVGDFFMSLRIAITGSNVTPPLNESMEILGKEEVIKRLKNA